MMPLIAALWTAAIFFENCMLRDDTYSFVFTHYITCCHKLLGDLDSMIHSTV